MYVNNCLKILSAKHEYFYNYTFATKLINAQTYVVGSKQEKFLHLLSNHCETLTINSSCTTHACSWNITIQRNLPTSNFF